MEIIINKDVMKIMKKYRITLHYRKMLFILLCFCISLNTDINQESAKNNDQSSDISYKATIEFSNNPLPISCTAPLGAIIIKGTVNGEILNIMIDTVASNSILHYKIQSNLREHRQLIKQSRMLIKSKVRDIIEIYVDNQFKIKMRFV